MLENIAICCAEHLRKFTRKDPIFSLVRNGEAIHISLGEDKDQDFDIIVDDFSVSEDDDTNEGTTLMPGRSFVKIIDGDTEHGDLLDACLDALAQDADLQPAINDLTTDGDGKDCEAIFNVENYGYVILKVR